MEYASTENTSTDVQGWKTQVRKREERSPILHAFTLSPAHNTSMKVVNTVYIGTKPRAGSKIGQRRTNREAEKETELNE